MSRVGQDYFPRNISQYVPLMEFAADVIQGQWFGSLGAPQALDLNGILVGASATTSVQTYTSADWATTFDGSATHLGESAAGSISGKYGRCLTMTGTAGADHVVTVTGKDYLGQLMSEAFTLSGTVAQVGVKAFKYVDTVSAAVGASGDTFDLGWNDKLGVPYSLQVVTRFLEDGVTGSPTTVVANRSTGTATSTDARGSIVPATATNGSREYEVAYSCYTSDLHGLAAYSS